MISFDTNVALRLVIEDDPEQCDRAGRAFSRAVAEGGESSRDAHALPVVTFDERFARTTGVDLVPT